MSENIDRISIENDPYSDSGSEYTPENEENSTNCDEGSGRRICLNKSVRRVHVYCKNEPNAIFYKGTLQNDYPFNKINIAKAPAKGRPPNLVNIVQEPLYPNRRPVKPVKKKHMSDLLPYISLHYHPLPVVNERTRASKVNMRVENNVSDSDDSDYID
ncbi:unnamed protein product [Psylliodes chrysocephalus]|uniref:Uncharacterized protein n=1 Tax=Psylliodes chrysocephalus TaxID=3402493 RepID=A0A9P0GAG5_9CUCU|nr:unnamed protein product [Psylliodes chrysocephala]